MLTFLRTGRLLLRQFTRDDAELLVELGVDPLVIRYITGGIPTSRAEMERDVLPAFLGYYQRFPGYGFWAALETSTGEFLGWFLSWETRRPGHEPNGRAGFCGLNHGFGPIVVRRSC